MNKQIVGIFYYPWNENYKLGETRISLHGWNLFDLYCQVVWYKARPRTERYMKTLFYEYYPHGTYININHAPHHLDGDIYWADTIVLLYPDANGIGFRSLEQEVFKFKKKKTAVLVLNGRRRNLLLTKSTRFSLLCRRFLEQTMLVEVLCLPLFLLITPILLIVDLLKFKR